MEGILSKVSKVGGPGYRTNCGVLSTSLDLHAGKDRVGPHQLCISEKDEAKLGSRAAKSKEAGKQK